MRALFLLGVVLAGAAQPAVSQASVRKAHFGATGGLITPGAFYWVEGPYESYDLSLSPSLGGFVDLQLNESVAVGGFLNFHMLNAFDESGTMIDLGAALKAKLAGGGAKPSWHAVVEVGHARLSSIFVFEGTSYLTVKGGAEMRIAAGSRQWVAQALIWGGPMGGNSDVTTTFGPTGMLRFGVRF